MTSYENPLLSFQDDDDLDWSVDTSEDAVKERMQSLTSGAKGLTLNDDLEKTQQERLDIFYQFVKVTFSLHLSINQNF